MSNELQATHDTGRHLVAVIGNAVGDTWDGATGFVARTNASVVAHPVAMSELAATCRYRADAPAGVLAADGPYTVEVYDVASAGVIVLAEVQAGPVNEGPFYVIGGVAVSTLAAKEALGALVDGTMTLRQSLALAVSVVAGNYADVRDTVAHTLTVTYYRQDRTTVLCVMVTTYTDSTFVQTVSRSVTWSNLP